MAKKKIRIQIKRVYDPPITDDGIRILVDRLWPRGLNKTQARVDFWAKELAPTTPLRKWFNHKEQKFGEFRIRYLVELRLKQDLAKTMLNEVTCGTITLLFAAQDHTHNHAVILKSFLEKNLIR